MHSLLITRICRWGCVPRNGSERESEWGTQWGGVMDNEWDTGRHCLACLLTKGYRADLQIAYSHERICNEKRFVTKLNSPPVTHTHTREVSSLLAFPIYSAGIGHQCTALANAFSSILNWWPFPCCLLRFPTLLLPVSQQMNWAKERPISPRYFSSKNTDW